MTSSGPHRSPLVSSLLTTIFVVAVLAAAGCGSAPDCEGGACTSSSTASPGTDAATPSYAASIPATEAGALLRRSLAYHDPEALWLRRPLVLEWVSTQPDADERVAELAIDNTRGSFALDMHHRGHDLDYTVEGGELSVQVDGTTEITAEVQEAVSLHREDGFMWRNYFTYLAGLPMKLTDDEATLADAVQRTRFQGEAVDAIEVTYETADGYPHWAFYFDPESAALMGARFWRLDPDRDGEYIVMEGLVEAGSLTLPNRRHWYMNADDRYLGTDEVRALRVVPSGGRP